MCCWIYTALSNKVNAGIVQDVATAEGNSGEEIPYGPDIDLTSGRPRALSEGRLLVGNAPRRHDQRIGSGGPCMELPPQNQ